MCIYIYWLRFARKPLYHHIYMYMGHIRPIQALHTYICMPYICLLHSFACEYALCPLHIPFWHVASFRGHSWNRLFEVSGHASLGTQLVRPHRAPFCAICYLGRTNLQPSRWTSGGSGTQSTTTVWTSPMPCPSGQSPPPAPRGGSLAGRTPGRTGGQRCNWPNFARGVAAMCYAIAPSPGRLVWAALPCVSEHCPGQQTDG